MFNSVYIRFLILILVLSLYSCHSLITDRYSEDEIVNIMLDAHTLGLVYNRQEVRTDSLKMAYYDVLEERYGMDQEEFGELVDGLILNSDLYDKVYTRINKMMEKMENREMDGRME